MRFSLTPLRYRDPELPLSNAICTVGHFPVECAHSHYSFYHVVVPRVLHFSAFI